MFHLSRSVFTLFILFTAVVARCEVVFDGTMKGRPGSLEARFNDKLGRYLFIIGADKGRLKGANLFHSFASFNVSANEMAYFHAQENSGIDNVISRVTGGYPSYLDGSLSSNIAGADFYFLNPAGVMFGPNALISLPGSFHVSTADYLRLGAEGRFDAGNPQQSRFSSAPPEAFGFLGSEAAPISKKGGFLWTVDGETVSLTGGDIRLQDDPPRLSGQSVNSYIRAAGGTINLVSVASDGEVPVDAAELSSDSFAQWGRIEISDSSQGDENFQRISPNIDASGRGGGRVYIHGGEIIFDNGHVYADTFGDITGKGITINATEHLTLKNGGKLTTETTLYGDFDKRTGNAGDIRITTPRLKLENGGQLLSTTRTEGNAGNIHIKANSIDISGSMETSIGPKGSAIFTTTGNYSEIPEIGDGGDIHLEASVVKMSKQGGIRADTKGFGDAGEISITTDKLILQEGGRVQLTAENRGEFGAILSGNAGKLTIQAHESVEISGQFSADIRSGLTSSAYTRGQGGEITVATPLLEIRDGGIIEAGTFGYGAGGEITLDVDTLSLQGKGGIHVDTDKHGSADAGKITINAAEKVKINTSFLVPALRAEPGIRRSALSGIRQPGKDEGMQRGAHNRDVPRRAPARVRNFPGSGAPRGTRHSALRAVWHPAAREK